MCPPLPPETTPELHEPSEVSAASAKTGNRSTRSRRIGRTAVPPVAGITVLVDPPYAAEADAAALAQAVSAALQAEGRGGAEVTVVVTSDEAIQALNEQFRGVPDPTDVLSFPAQEPSPKGRLRIAQPPARTPGFVTSPEAANYLGDIVIALPYTRQQAADLGRSLEAELRLLAVHGALHLLGYDHAEPDDEARMWARQDALLATLSQQTP